MASTEPTRPASTAVLLRAYDEQLRTDLASAISQEQMGPVLLGTFVGGRGFVTYRDLDAITDIEDLVVRVLGHFEAEKATRIEWKTRGHDHAPGLHEALIRHGFVAQEPESIMIGEASALDVDVALPPQIVVRRLEPDDRETVHRMCVLQYAADGLELDPDYEAAIWRRFTQPANGDDMELWVAQDERGEVVCAGRLELVPNSDFAGLWGGATRADLRGRGLYRALTAERARSAIAHGKRLLHSDSTEFSRPILERSGFVKVTTTTPYEWTRPGSQ